jgi:hypothetical protein
MSRSALFVLGCLCLACEMPRPAGAYGLDTGDAAAMAAPDPMDEIGEDEIPDLDGTDGDDKDGGSDGPEPDEDGGAPVVEDTPLVKLQKELSGDYWMRVDFYSTASESGVEIDTHTTAYSLVRIGLDDADKLKMIDWQCYVGIDQDCAAGCSNATTSIRPEGGRAYRPAIRTMTVNLETGAWNTTEEWFAVGWKGSYAEDPTAVLPARDDDPLIYDPDGAGAGINIDLYVDPSAPLVPSVDCTIRVVQKYVQGYNGILMGRSLAQGNVTDRGSDQFVLDYGDCPSGADARQSAPTTMRLARATTAIDEQWTCPSDGIFRAALPSP